MKTNEAIARITDEMMRADDPLIQMLEEHFTKICTNEEIAIKLLAEDKTLKGASTIIWAEAKKRQIKSGAWVPDEECCEMAEDYFGITPDMKNIMTRAAIVNILDEI